MLETRKTMKEMRKKKNFEIKKHAEECSKVISLKLKRLEDLKPQTKSSRDVQQQQKDELPILLSTNRPKVS